MGAESAAAGHASKEAAPRVIQGSAALAVHDGLKPRPIGAGANDRGKKMATRDSETMVLLQLSVASLERTVKAQKKAVQTAADIKLEAQATREALAIWRQKSRSAYIMRGGTAKRLHG